MTKQRNALQDTRDKSMQALQADLRDIKLAHATTVSNAQAAVTEHKAEIAKLQAGIDSLKAELEVERKRGHPAAIAPPLPAPSDSSSSSSSSSSNNNSSSYSSSNHIGSSSSTSSSSDQIARTPAVDMARFSDLKYSELLNYCKEQNIKLKSGRNKTSMLKAIEQHLTAAASSSSVFNDKTGDEDGDGDGNGDAAMPGDGNGHAAMQETSDTRASSPDPDAATATLSFGVSQSEPKPTPQPAQAPAAAVAAADDNRAAPTGSFEPGTDSLDAIALLTLPSQLPSQPTTAPVVGDPMTEATLDQAAAPADVIIAPGAAAIAAAAASAPAATDP